MTSSEFTSPSAKTSNEYLLREVKWAGEGTVRLRRIRFDDGTRRQSLNLKPNPILKVFPNLWIKLCVVSL